MLVTALTNTAAPLLLVKNASNRLPAASLPTLAFEWQPVMAEPIVVFLGKDIFFAPTVKSAAEGAGWRLVMAPNLAALGDRAPAEEVKAAIIDLTSLSNEQLKDLGASLGAAYPAARRVAFGPHVQVDSFAAASAAGFDPVLPKGAVAASLPRLLASIT